MRELLARWLRRLACWLDPEGHAWQPGPDTDEDGWFFDDGWGAWGISRSCELCFRFEHLTDAEAGRGRVAAALDRRRARLKDWDDDETQSMEESAGSAPEERDGR